MPPSRPDATSWYPSAGPPAADEPASLAAEAALLARLRAGDAEALAALYDLHAGRVFAIASRFDREAAEDLTQEVFLKLWQRPERFAGRCRLATWLYRLTVNAALDHERRRGRRRTPQLGGSPIEPPAPAATGPDRETAFDLATALAALPLKLRVPVVLRYYGGLDYREIAAVLGCREGTVASRLCRALERLAKRLDANARRASS